ncbi:WD40 repeat-like protein [Stemphylium lycopersici]|uniref:WD40 repeat-like protein n=1 Tax=Stemphylium lycopersici TaxID=183478 RepID=A0A364N1L8_STELY|nr:WD40 repeat-like protein [Stemphylium lycopersici]
MPLELHQMTEADTLSWTRVRAIAYYGPTHDVLHNGPISESSMRGVAEDRKREIDQPNTWHWKIVDTDVEPNADDPPDNGGRTIAISVWSMHNLATEAGHDGSNEVSSVPVEKTDKVPAFLPPELRLDALSSLLGPLRAAQESIMGTTKRYLKLNQLATHPDYQGRGAARIMLDWGMEKADREGLAVYLDATEKGIPVYERRGFKVVKGFEWDRVPWVLPLANSAGGHRLGVNGLAVDPQNSILYSGGRDGVICAWDLHLDLNKSDPDERDPFADSNAADFKPPPTQFRQQVQAHTHWINDIVLAQNNNALVSASSDITVKVWRPAATDQLPPQTIGLHTDYVKRVASPGGNESWIASGGLDRKISLWDLNGAGKKLEIAVGEDENTAKGSVYALAATPNLIASGGPESIVRVWDQRSGKRITKFVGHTDNVRDILLAQDGDMILTGSSDQTVKVWSMTAGRCMYTLTMHNDSVWSLHSDSPELDTFYSSDRSGLVAKSDVRNCAEMDEGVSVAVCQEHDGVNKLVAAGDYIWTATSSSSINRWNDVETAAEIELPESYKWHRNSVSTMRSRYPSPPGSSPPVNGATPKIPLKSLLRMSHTAPFPQALATKDTDASTLASARKPSEVLTAADHSVADTVRPLPDFTIEGQNGLIKHHLLNDRRRVLTLDTAGEVVLWDLLQCMPIKSFGKTHMEHVLPEVNTQDSVAHWCAVDTRIGTLTCMLEENYCFDAETYADELHLEEDIDFREDHRINLGKWILRYLFSNLIDEEIKRDEIARSEMLKQKEEEPQPGRPTNIEMPDMNINGWRDATSGPTSGSTIKAENGLRLPHTPGLAIGLATPMAGPASAGRNSTTNPLTPTKEEGAQLEKTQTQRSLTQDGVDYFGAASGTNGNGNGKPGDIPKEGSTDSKEEPVQSPTETDTPTKKGKGMFGKKFNMSFNMKKFSTGTAAPEPAKPAVDEKAEDSDSRSNKTDEKTIEDNFYGAIQRIRQGYEEQLAAGATKLDTEITPSLTNETPVLKPPAMTTILIQEDRPDSGGVADLFEGKVGTLGSQADLIEKAAPMWLAEVLLRNQLPPKDIVKVSFVLEPFGNALPSISSDGYIPFSLPFETAAQANATLSNNRLNANRMLRARKILGYVAERIEPAPTKEDLQRDGPALKPEEYLELYCNGQLIPPTMTLASIRAHVWRGGGDVLLYYKANGRKEIKQAYYPGPQSGAPPGPMHGLKPGAGLNSTPGSSNASEGKQSSEAERSAKDAAEPRKIAPPTLIQPTRGPKPAKKALGPDCLSMVDSMVNMGCFSVASIMRVLSTSNGVVIPAATAPATLPKAPPSQPLTSALPVCAVRYFFSASQSGNWMTVNGTSRIIVMDHPRYNSNHTCANPRVMKKRAAPGAEPTIALPTPRYMPLKPPLAAKPEEDWSRVFRVSSGCHAQGQDRRDDGTGQGTDGLNDTVEEKVDDMPDDGPAQSENDEIDDDTASNSRRASSSSGSPLSSVPNTEGSSDSDISEPNLQNVRHTSCIQEAQLSPDGSCILTSDYDRAFSVYPVSTDTPSQDSVRHLTPYASFRSANPIWSFAVNPLFNLQDATSTTVLVSRRDSYITLHNALWDTSPSYNAEESQPPTTSPVDISNTLASYKLINSLTEAVTAPISLTFSHDGAHFFGGSQDKIVIFDMQDTDKPIHTIPTIPARRNKLKGGGRGFKGYISALSLSSPSTTSHDGLLAAGSWTRHVGIYDPVSGTNITHLALPGTTTAATSGVKLRNENLKHVMGDGVSSLKWSPCGQYLYVAERNSDVLLIYDVRNFSLSLAYCTGRKALTKQKLGFDIWNAGASPYDIEGLSHEIWAGGTDGRIRVWRDPYVKEGAVEADEVVSVGDEDEPVVAALVHPSGSLAAAACGVVKIAGEGERRGRKRGGGLRPICREWGSLEILALG